MCLCPPVFNFFYRGCLIITKLFMNAVPLKDTSAPFDLTLRLLMSYIYIYIYIYGAPILDVSRSHNDAAQSVGLLWTSDQLVAETST